MKKVLTAFFVISVFLFAACSGDNTETNGNSAQPVEKYGELTLIYTGNIGGKINPCGCRTPLGGYARRSTAVKSIRSEKENSFYLDSGAMLFSNYYLYTPFDRISGMLSHLIADLNYDMGLDALNVTSYDISNSPDSLLALKNKYPNNWISGNMVWRDSGEPLFDGSTIINVGEFRVGVFGIMAQKSHGIDIILDDSPVKVTDPEESAREAVEKLSRECDLIVALAYMDVPRIEKLVTAVPGIDVIISSHTREHNPSSEHEAFMPVKLGETLVVRCPDGGRVLGQLDLSIAKSDTDFSNSEEYIDLRPLAVREKDQTPQKSLYTNTFIDLGPNIESDPAVRAKVAEFSKEVYSFTESRGMEFKVQ